MSGSEHLGRFVWYDLMTTDPDSARDFYRSLIGWGTAPFEASPGPYSMWTNQDKPLGGVMQLPEEATQAGAPPHWLPYIFSPDLEDTTSKARELGAEVLVPPTDIPKAGSFAVFRDPLGGVFATYQSAEDPEPQRHPEVGEFSWHELATTDPEKAFDFYRQLFGWGETDSMDMGEMGVYRMYGQGDFTYGGIFKKPPEMPGPSAWMLYIKVPDINQATEKVKELGGQVLNGPMEVPGGDMIAHCADRQGAVFALHAATS